MCYHGVEYSVKAGKSKENSRTPRGSPAGCRREAGLAAADVKPPLRAVPTTVVRLVVVNDALAVTIAAAIAIRVVAAADTSAAFAVVIIVAAAHPRAVAVIAEPNIDGCGGVRRESQKGCDKEQEGFHR